MSRASAEGNGILAEIGNTPLVQLDRILDDEIGEEVEIWAKLESSNPGGSVKDRPARQIILDAIESGELDGETRLIDSTSGNTGIAYAMIGAALGIDVDLVMPENASRARKHLIDYYGANLIYSDPLEGSDGAYRKVREILDSDSETDYFYADQYGNPSNPRAHYLTTGPEIVRQTDGRITHFVAGLGTSGTMMGTGRYLKESLEHDVELVGVQPSSGFHGLEGLKHMESAIQPEIYDPESVDIIEEIETELAWDHSRALGRREGIGAGYSSGANIAAALRLARRIDRGVIVAIICDHAERYIEGD